MDLLYKGHERYKRTPKKEIHKFNPDLSLHENINSCIDGLQLHKFANDYPQRERKATEYLFSSFKYTRTEPGRITGINVDGKIYLLLNNNQNNNTYRTDETFSAQMDANWREIGKRIYLTKKEEKEVYNKILEKLCKIKKLQSQFDKLFRQMDKLKHKYGYVDIPQGNTGYSLRIFHYGKTPTIKEPSRFPSERELSKRRGRKGKSLEEETKEMIEISTEMIKIDTEWQQTNLIRGKHLFDLKEYRRALDDFNITIERDERHWEARFMKSTTLFMLRLPVKAFHECELIVKFAPEDSRLTGPAIDNMLEISRRTLDVEALIRSLRAYIKHYEKEEGSHYETKISIYKKELQELLKKQKSSKKVPELKDGGTQGVRTSFQDIKINYSQRTKINNPPPVAGQEKEDVSRGVKPHKYLPKRKRKRRELTPNITGKKRKEPSEVTEETLHQRLERDDSHNKRRKYSQRNSIVRNQDWKQLTKSNFTQEEIDQISSEEGYSNGKEEYLHFLENDKLYKFQKEDREDKDYIYRHESCHPVLSIDRETMEAKSWDRAVRNVPTKNGKYGSLKLYSKIEKDSVPPRKYKPSKKETVRKMWRRGR